MHKKLKIHLLDSLGSLLYATQRPTIQKLARQLKAVGGAGPCRAPLIGTTSPDRAAQMYTALIRYPDFMDNFLGKEATCHPSDNIGVLLALSSSMECSGKDFLTAMAVGYAIECRLVEEIPVMIKGFDQYSTSCLFDHSSDLANDRPYRDAGCTRSGNCRLLPESAGREPCLIHL
jgi:2-methylcitrate dehydratase